MRNFRKSAVIDEGFEARLLAGLDENRPGRLRTEAGFPPTFDSVKDISIGQAIAFSAD